MADFVSVVLIGLLGSLHCVGMCGGFAVALSQTESVPRRLLVRQALYLSGKSLTYAVLGGVAGGLGAGLGDLFGGLQNVLSVLLGGTLIGIGLGLVGLLKRLNVSFGTAALSQAMGRLLGRRTRSAPFALGLANGLLPCGLVYAALAVAAATGSTANGALVMGVFGLSTVPSLLLVGTVGFAMRPARRRRLSRLSGVVVIALGVLTVLRGTPALAAIMHALQ